MRFVGLAAVLALAGCRGAESRPTPEPADAGAPLRERVEAGVADSAPAVEADAGSVARPPRALPSAAHLAAALEGESVRGFIAMSNGADHVYSAFAAESSAEKPVWVASFTKLWTAIAVLRAVERGTFSLDDDIATLLPDLKSKAWSDSTVRSLLGHVSRVPEFDDSAGYYAKVDVDFTVPVPVLAKYIGAGTEKRGVWKYRNSEFALLGAILQAKAGSPAAEVLARDVWTPAGMTHAGLAVGRAMPPDVDVAPVGHLRPHNFFTAGAGYASANDLLAFFDALGAGKLLRADSRALLFSGSGHDHASLGCWAFPFAGTLLVERPGSFGNVRLFTAFFPEENRAIVMWSGASVEVGRPRTKGTLAAKLAGLGLE